MNIADIPFIPIIVALIGSLFWLLLTIRLAPRIGLLDLPSDRKKHGNSIPVVGGVAMSLALAPALLLLQTPVPYADRFGVAAIVTLVVGIWDDHSGLRVRTRFLVEFAIGMIVTVGGGLMVMTLGDLVGLGEINLGFLAAPFTIICIIGVINALNMVDGVDGLAAGLAMVSFAVLCYLAFAAGRQAEAELILLIIAVLIPFFILNSRLFGQSQAKLFMGDAGSKLLGLSLAWFTISLSQTLEQTGAEPLPPAFPAVTALWLLALPLIEMFSSFLRRLVKRKNPFKPDSKHMHHLLLTAGMSVNMTVLILVVFGAIVAMSGAALGLAGFSNAGLFFGLLIIFAIYCLISLKFWEHRQI